MKYGRDVVDAGVVMAVMVVVGLAVGKGVRCRGARKRCEEGRARTGVWGRAICGAGELGGRGEMRRRLWGWGEDVKSISVSPSSPASATTSEWIPLFSWIFELCDVRAWDCPIDGVMSEV